MGRLFAAVLLLVLGLGAGAEAAPTFRFNLDSNAPSIYRNTFRNCIAQFNAAGGLAARILRQLDGARITLFYQKGGAGTGNPNGGGSSAGRPIDLSWDPRIGGVYDEDRAPKVPCAVLLHELQHAARYFNGTECNGILNKANSDAYFYDEQMGSRAENFWLQRTGKKQRTKYDFYGEVRKLERWTRWPSAGRVPQAPPCQRCGSKDPLGAVAATEEAVCARCTRFQQEGCVDFKGGIYSGGDHRRVASGSLKIIIGPSGYCQGRKHCEFKSCVTCPHLDTAIPKGLEVTAIAKPDKESRFARWGPGACRGQGPVCTFTARRNSCISAQFLLTDPPAPPQTLPNVPCRSTRR